MHEVNLKKYDLNLLVALEVVLQEKHVTKSAERLNISQPAMSRTLTRLREMFDDRLLVRTPDGYIKTPRAERLETQLSETLKSIAHTIDTPQFDPKFARAVFKLCTLDYGEVLVVPELLRLLERHAPYIVVETIQRSNYTVQEVQKGVADVTIGIAPTNPAKNCKVEQLFEDRYVCVMDENHPLANDKLTLKSYLSYGHSVTNTGSSTLRRVDQTLETLGVKRRVLKRSPQFLASIFSCKQTRLLQTTPLRHLAPLLAPMGLVAKELPFKMNPIQYCQIWHVRNDDDPAQKWFRQQITDAAVKIQNTVTPVL